MATRKFEIWYSKPSHFSRGIMGELPSARHLSNTHVHLKTLDLDGGLSAVFYAMQGEVWSPNGEARDLIRRKGLEHTSMSVGDVIVDDVGNAHLVDIIGFKAIGGVK